MACKSCHQRQGVNWRIQSSSSDWKSNDLNHDTFTVPQGRQEAEEQKTERTWQGAHNEQDKRMGKLFNNSSNCSLICLWTSILLHMDRSSNNSYVISWKHDHIFVAYLDHWRILNIQQWKVIVLSMHGNLSVNSILNRVNLILVHLIAGCCHYCWGYKKYWTNLIVLAFHHGHHIIIVHRGCKE